MNTDELKHLQPSCRSAALLTNDERIHWLRQERWIQYPRAQRVLDRLMELVDYPPRDRFALLAGACPYGALRTTRANSRIRSPKVSETSFYFPAFFCFAQRALTAATILARPSADILRFLATGAAVALALPGVRLTVVPAYRALACCRRAISPSSSASIFLVSICEP